MFIFLSFISPIVIGRVFLLLSVIVFYQLQQLTIISIQGKNNGVAYFVNKNVGCVLTFSTRGFGFVIYNNVRIKSWGAKWPITFRQVQQYYSINKVFLLTKTAQNSFGLKNGDYARYRRYCSNKVLKLRHRMGVKFGTKMKFIRKDLLK